MPQPPWQDNVTYKHELVGVHSHTYFSDTLAAGEGGDLDHRLNAAAGATTPRRVLVAAVAPVGGQQGSGAALPPPAEPVARGKGYQVAA